MRLVSVYRTKGAERILYDLLRERLETPGTNISHRQMPTWRKHLTFVRSRPYAHWYIVRFDGHDIGAVYLTRADEIGAALFKSWHGRGLGAQAIQALMRRHKRKHYLANINPRNARSIALFRSLGFNLLQETYELRPVQP